jgi:hypothetical protein
MQALVGEAKFARPALTAEIHQEYDASRSNGRMRAGANGYHCAGSFVSGRGGCAIKELRFFGAAQGVGVYLQQKLSRAGLGNWFFNECDLFVSHK